MLVINSLYPYRFCRYPEQESYPINMKNGSYYYIEALHKEQYGNDSLAVAVRTPDSKFHAPIPSDYLWTLPPPKPHGMIIHRQNCLRHRKIAGQADGLRQTHMNITMLNNRRIQTTLKANSRKDIIVSADIFTKLLVNQQFQLWSLQTHETNGLNRT